MDADNIDCIFFLTCSSCCIITLIQLHGPLIILSAWTWHYIILTSLLSRAVHPCSLHLGPAYCSVPNGPPPFCHHRLEDNRDDYWAAMEKRYYRESRTASTTFSQDQSFREWYKLLENCTNTVSRPRPAKGQIVYTQQPTFFCGFHMRLLTWHKGFQEANRPLEKSESLHDSIQNADQMKPFTFYSLVDTTQSIHGPIMSFE